MILFPVAVFRASAVTVPMETMRRAFPENPTDKSKQESERGIGWEHNLRASLEQFEVQ